MWYIYLQTDIAIFSELLTLVAMIWQVLKFSSVLFTNPHERNPIFLVLKWWYISKTTAGSSTKEIPLFDVHYFDNKNLSTPYYHCIYTVIYVIEIWTSGLSVSDSPQNPEFDKISSVANFWTGKSIHHACIMEK